MRFPVCLGWLPGSHARSSNTVVVLLIIGITIVALGSVPMGMDAGVKRLSEINMIMAATPLSFFMQGIPAGRPCKCAGTCHEDGVHSACYVYPA